MWFWHKRAYYTVKNSLFYCEKRYAYKLKYYENYGIQKLFRSTGGELSRHGSSSQEVEEEYLDYEGAGEEEEFDPAQGPDFYDLY